MRGQDATHTSRTSSLCLPSHGRVPSARHLQHRTRYAVGVVSTRCFPPLTSGAFTQAPRHPSGVKPLRPVTAERDLAAAVVVVDVEGGGDYWYAPVGRFYDDGDGVGGPDSGRRRVRGVGGRASSTRTPEGPRPSPTSPARARPEHGPAVYFSDDAEGTRVRQSPPALVYFSDDAEGTRVRQSPPALPSCRSGTCPTTMRPLRCALDPDGKGRTVASDAVPRTGTCTDCGDPNGSYGVWDFFTTVPFGGGATSVRFAGRVYKRAD
jgi:hypothetical protein